LTYVVKYSKLFCLQNGELDGVNPKVVVLLGGTNNLAEALSMGVEAGSAELVRGLRAIVRTIQEKAPAATIIVTGIFPRYDNRAFLPIIDRVNADLAKLADGAKVRYLNVNAKLEDPAMLNRDKLHPALPGYQVWADALKPIFTELLGPPAKEDHAPPPTGDPSARK